MTKSSNFLVTAGALQPNNLLMTDGFIAWISNRGSQPPPPPPGNEKVYLPVAIR